MSGTAEENSQGRVVATVNGHEVTLLPSNGVNAPDDASQTDWFIVKFARFVDYNLKTELRQRGLEVYDNLGENSHLCKYSPSDLAPINNIDAVSHIAMYPASVVPTVDIGSTTRTENALEATEAVKMPFVLKLQPNPAQSPAQVLETLQASFQAEPLDTEISGDTLRVMLDPATIPGVSRIDSVRTISKVKERVPFSVRQRAIMKFSTTGTTANFKGHGETVYIADTGFDNGLATNKGIHPAFTGRVLAATIAKGAIIARDENGHGTHVAGSILGHLEQDPKTDMSNLVGTAPESSLISIALDFSNFPQTLGLLTQDVAPYGPPIVMNNSWGNKWTGDQHSYGIDDAEIVDRVMYENSHACIVFAAGNDGDRVGTNGVQKQIGDFASAKNCITVGASYSDRPLDPTDFAYMKGGKVHSTSEMTTFSSTGPTSDGRLAPDVVAPGAVILSARSGSISPENLSKCLTNYGKPDLENLLFMDGTSMAAPAVTGCVAVLRGAFRDQQKAIPTGALLKALVIHGAVDLVGTTFTVKTRKETGSPTSAQYKMTAAPNPFQGYGLVDINNSLVPIIGAVTGQRGYVDGSLPSGDQQKIYALDVPSTAKSLTVTLAYTDLPGAALQNHIDLSIKLSNGTTLLPLPPTDPVGRKFDWKPSNVAKVFATNPSAGEATIFVSVKSSEPSAKFAVVWTVI
ncbi:peptidase S8/S53 domain-containing protein [Xylariales sp. PMI_506]|nr:peptidase S8/S53 domain-containing protein [Xylariales sp. PMI_506]